MMTVQAIADRFFHTLDTWEKALDGYTMEELTRQPDPDSWSVGQVYLHLTGSAERYHLRRLDQCLEDMSHADEPMDPRVVPFFAAGELPDIRVKVPPSPQYTPPQPERKAQLREKIDWMRAAMQAAAEKLAKDPPSGKAAHMAYGYLNAAEWFELIDMHFRHHLRQKARLDVFLGKP